MSIRDFFKKAQCSLGTMSLFVLDKLNSVSNVSQPFRGKYLYSIFAVPACCVFRVAENSSKL